MGRIILAVSMLVTVPVFADTYDTDFQAQVKELTAKVETIGDDLKIENVRIEDLEAMRLRVEG